MKLCEIMSSSSSSSIDLQMEHENHLGANNGELGEELTSSATHHHHQLQHVPVSNQQTSARKRRSKSHGIMKRSGMSYELIFAMIMLCSSALHKSVLAADDMMTSHGNGGGSIQRKRGGGVKRNEYGGNTAAADPPLSSSLQLHQLEERITTHRKLAADHRRLQQAAGVETTDPSLCTCSPQIFNVKITLTATDPCSNDDLKSNGGIDNTLCLYTNPTAEGLYPPAPVPVVTVAPTDDPFRPPLSTTPSMTNGPTASKAGGGGGIPTYSPTTSTYEPTITAMPITPFPSFTPTKAERMGLRDGSNQGDGDDDDDDDAPPPTYQPTYSWPTYVPTTTNGDDDQGGSSGGSQGGWLSLDDDEIIGPHHHRHHHHHQPSLSQEEEGGSTEDESGEGRRKLELSGRKRVINVDELIQKDVNVSGENEDGAIEDKDESSSSNDKEVKPPYYQPPAVMTALDKWLSIHPNDAFFDNFPELKAHQEEIYRLKHGLPTLSSSSSTTTASSTNNRALQAGQTTPTQLISAQFLEMDTSPDMQIINQDDQYINVTFPDPSNIVLQFSSISNLLDPAIPLSDQMQYVPGGAIILLLGATSSGEIVRNRMMWTYTMGCGLEDYTVLDGDVIGWAGFENLTPARLEFCPASGNLPPPTTRPPTPSPTVTPSMPTTKEPTSKSPSIEMPSTMKPTKKPSSKKPSMSMGSGDIFDHFDLSGKSNKKKKKKRRGGGVDGRNSGVDDKIEEDFRVLRRRESVMEFGRPQ